MGETPPLAARQKPGLTETLGLFPAHRHICRSCGADDSDEGANESHELWAECDEFDKPYAPARVVTLCGRCSTKLIEPHPRLYIQVDTHKPVPGVMELCVDCTLRTGMQCSSPLLKANGGAGMEVKYPEPIRAFLCRGKGSGLTHIYRGAPTSCAGRTTNDPHALNATNPPNATL